jgi:hypothetical protein
MSEAADKFSAHLKDIATLLLGEPNKRLSSADSLRWGSKGSMHARLKEGVWFNHEAGEGGGVLDLIAQVTGLHGPQAVQWMRDKGFDIPDDRTRQKPAAPPARFNPDAQADFRQTAAYDYVDETGRLSYQVVRLETGAVGKDGKPEKTFRQRRPDPGDRSGWTWKLDGVKPLPYRLPDLLRAVDAGEIIFVVEGEKAAEALRLRGAVATCNSGGAGKFPDDLLPYFKGAEVIVLADNDPQAKKPDGTPKTHANGDPVRPGQDHARDVARRLRAVADKVTVLEFPDLPPKGDVVEYFDAGGKLEDLYRRADKPEPEAARPFLSRFKALRWEDLDKPGPEHEYLIDDFLTAGEKCVIGGPSRSGKSFLTIHAAMSIARGVDFFGRTAQPGLVVYQAGEGVRGIKKRLRAYRKHNAVPADEKVPFVLLQSQVDLWRPDGDTGPLIEEITEIAKAYPVPLRLVVIDTLATATGGADENSGRDMGAVMQNISRINSTTGASVLLVHHMNAQGAKLRGHTSIYANVDQVILCTVDEVTKVRTVILDKQKDDEDGLSFKFELLPVEVGVHETGRSITSCVVVDVGDKAKAMSARAAEGFRLKPTEEPVFRALLAAIEDQGQQAPSDLKLPLGTRVVQARHWKEALLRSSMTGIGDEAGDEAAVTKRNEAIRKQIERAGEVMLKFRVIGRSAPYVWWTGRAVAGFPETFSRVKADKGENPPLPPDAEDFL